jgi:hypothetical protein
MEASRELFTRNAATNKITVAEANDTLVADTFENESGSASLNDSGDFVTTGSVTAGSGEVGNAANTKSVAYGDFTNAGANIDSDGTSHGNLLVAGADVTTAGDTVTTIAGSGTTPANIINDNLGDLSNHNPGGTLTYRIDLGSGEVFDAYRHYSYTGSAIYNPTQVVIEASNTEGSGYVTLATIDTSDLVNDTGVWHIYGFTNSTSYRYVQLTYTNTNDGATNRTVINEIELSVGTWSTTNNTIRAAGDVGVAIAPGSTVLDDEGDAPITASGVVNVRISTDSGSSFGSFEDYTDDFKTRTALISPDTGSDFVVLEFQPVDDQRIRSVDLVSQSAKINMGGSGVDFTVNGVKIFDVNTGGNVDFTGSPTVLTEGANVAVNGSLGPVFTLQVDDENFTIDNPTNIRIGKPYYFFITQDDVAARTITWGTAFKFAGGSAETLTASTGAVDMYVFISHDGSTLTHLYSTKNIS